MSEPTNRRIVTPEDMKTARVGTILIVPGTCPPMPGWLPTTTAHPDGRCVVAMELTKAIESTDQKITIRTEGCTTFSVLHLDEPDQDPPTQDWNRRLMERSLAAINDLVIWMKTLDEAKTSFSFQKQIGQIDVKFYGLLRSYLKCPLVADNA